MKIDSIQNGIVIDHIAAGRGMQLYHLLQLDKLECSVAIIKNVTSHKMGKKDIIKVDGQLDINIDAIGYVDPKATINIIRDGELVAHYDHNNSVLESAVPSSKRYTRIKVQYQTLELKTYTKNFEGWTAQIIQHEIDHCNGILI